jgi:hypothetical protein
MAARLQGGVAAALGAMQWVFSKVSKMEFSMADETARGERGLQKMTFWKGTNVFS